MLEQLSFVYQADWIVEPFASKFYCLTQSDISLNFGDGLNFVTHEHSLNVDSFPG